MVECGQGNIFGDSALILFVRFRNTLLFIIVGLYLVLNQGFMQIRVPQAVGGGVPVGELMLLFVLLTVDHSKLAPRLSRTIFLLPFILWWGLGIGRALAGVPEYGMWALRDATHVIESLFLVVGFIFATELQRIESFFHQISVLLLIACVYGLSYPFGDILRSWSPVIVAGAGYKTYLLFNYVSAGLLLLWVAVYLVLVKAEDQRKQQIYLVFASCLLGYDILIFQSRTIYLQVMILFMFIIIYRKRLIVKWATSSILIFFILMFLFTAVFQIPGRSGLGVSPEYLVKHFVSIFGVEAEGVVGPARGVSQRLGWWLGLYEQWAADLETFLFGLGYGFPLIDFEIGYGVAVREPHNSYISIISRLGIFGVIVFGWLHILLMRVWRRAYKICKYINWREGASWLLFLMAFFLLVLILAFTQDAFEKPFWAIPYYFFWGYVLALYDRLRHGWKPDALAAMAADEQVGV